VSALDIKYEVNMKVYIVDSKLELNLKDIPQIIESEGFFATYFSTISDLSFHMSKAFEQPSVVLCSYDSVDFEYDDMKFLEHIPTIFYGEDVKTNTIKALMNGAKDYMVGPMDPDVLICKILAHSKDKRITRINY
jgi:PleD family two-component response regulator